MAIREAAANLFTPKERLESIYDVNFAYLQKKGIKGLILDIENTVLPPLTTAISLKCIQWFEKLKGYGFKACLVSNDINSKRISALGKALNLPVVHFAMKPFPWALEHAAYDILRLHPKDVAVIGDTLLTDILPGNIVSSHTILVEPIAEQNDPMSQWIVRRAGNAIARVITGRS